MITGLYAQASEGNVEAVKDYIDTKLLQVNRGVEQNISQMNQVSKIEQMEIKGLVLVKMMEAEKLKVNFQLEVLNAIDSVAMEINDFIRCLGILLDNAIEEATVSVNKEISCILLKENHKVSIVVKNHLEETKDLASIWEVGYSTKGEKRGLGLSNYKKILATYENIVCETKIENKQFIQVLIVL